MCNALTAPQPAAALKSSFDRQAPDTHASFAKVESSVRASLHCPMLGFNHFIPPPGAIADCSVSICGYDIHCPMYHFCWQGLGERHHHHSLQEGLVQRRLEQKSLLAGK
jgi:hypothetical protein